MNAPCGRFDTFVFPHGFHFLMRVCSGFDPHPHGCNSTLRAFFAAHFLLFHLSDNDDAGQVCFDAPSAAKTGEVRHPRLARKRQRGNGVRARDPSLERDVAIKVMAGPSLHDSSMQLRFEKEAKAVAQLHHPNIVTVHDLGYDDRGSPFIAMELLDGCDLDQLVEKEQPTLARKPGIVVQVCHGLAHANANGIVHRDIKPANIFVARDGTAKIMDFGVARWTQSSQTQAGIVVGTAGYIAPEQLRGHAVDGRADVFSIGVVLFELVTNQLLFSGDNIETIFFKTLTKSTPRLRFPDNRSLPGLQQIVEGALAKDPSERYATAGDMARAIEAFLHAYESELEKQRICLVLEHDSGVPDPEDETMRSKSVEPAPRKRPSSRRPTRRIARSDPHCQAADDGIQKTRLEWPSKEPLSIRTRVLAGLRRGSHVHRRGRPRVLSLALQGVIELGLRDDDHHQRSDSTPADRGAARASLCSPAFPKRGAFSAHRGWSSRHWRR